MEKQLFFNFFFKGRTKFLGCWRDKFFNHNLDKTWLSENGDERIRKTCRWQRFVRLCFITLVYSNVSIGKECPIRHHWDRLSSLGVKLMEFLISLHLLGSDRQRWQHSSIKSFACCYTASLSRDRKSNKKKIHQKENLEVFSPVSAGNITKSP